VAAENLLAAAVLGESPPRQNGDCTPTRSLKLEGLPGYKSIRDVPRRPDKINVYLPASILRELLPALAARGCDELWLNPGSQSDEILTQARSLGLNPIPACSILSLGLSPAQF